MEEQGSRNPEASPEPPPQQKPTLVQLMRAAPVTSLIIAANVIGPGAQGIAAGEFAELLAAIRSGNAYANVHTTKYPGGEIRGQIRADDDD